MALAYPMQKFQDWCTQQWVILWGKKINQKDFTWLMGPFGDLNGIGEDFIERLAENENLIIQREAKPKGLIPTIDMLNLPDTELSQLSENVIDFYENTTNYNLYFTVKWNPFFKFWGVLVNKLFSNRLKQLNIPTKNVKINEPLNSQIITLFDPTTNQIKYSVWLRTSLSTQQIIYSGIYGVCTLPSGKTCIRAIFPLPNGNATVIMHPVVGAKGELILNASGKKMGNAGFYFLLNDSKGNYWAQFIRSFRTLLIVNTENNQLSAKHISTLWHWNVFKFVYTIKLKE